MNYLVDFDVDSYAITEMMAILSNILLFSIVVLLIICFIKTKNDSKIKVRKFFYGRWLMYFIIWYQNFICILLITSYVKAIVFTFS